MKNLLFFTILIFFMNTHAFWSHEYRHGFKTYDDYLFFQKDRSCEDMLKLKYSGKRISEIKKAFQQKTKLNFESQKHISCSTFFHIDQSCPHGKPTTQKCWTKILFINNKRVTNIYVPPGEDKILLKAPNLGAPAEATVLEEPLDEAHH